MSKTQTPHSKHNENNNCADCHPGSERAWKWRKSIKHLFVYCNKQPSWLGPHWFPQHWHVPRQYGLFRPKWAGITPVFPPLFPEATWPARLVCVWPCHLAWLNVSTLFLIPLISRGGCQLLFLTLVERRLPSECLSDQPELNCSIENFIGFELWLPPASLRTKCKVGVLFSSPFYWIFQDRLRNKGIKLNRDKRPEKRRRRKKYTFKQIT